MVEAIYNRLEEHSKSFKLLDYDESFFSAREGIISAIQDMEDKEQVTRSISEVLEEGLLEVHEVSSPVCLKETATVVITRDATEGKLDNNVSIHSDDKLEELQQEEVKGTEAGGSPVQDCVVQNMDSKVQTAASNQSDLLLSTSEGVEKGLVDERGASPAVFVNKEVVTLQNQVLGDTSLVRLEASVIVHNDELEVLQQDSDEEEEMGVHGYFCCVWEIMSCCFNSLKQKL